MGESMFGLGMIHKTHTDEKPLPKYEIPVAVLHPGNAKRIAEKHGLVSRKYDPATGGIIQDIENPILKAGADTLSSALRDMESLVEIRGAVDPEKTQATRLKDFGKKVDGVMEKVARNISRLETALQGETEKLRRDISIKTGTHSRHPDAAEIRAYVRGLGDDERHSFIMNLADSGQVNAMSAILAAPLPEMVGLNASNLEAYRARLCAVVCKEENANLNALEDFRKHLRSVTDRLLDEDDALRASSLVREFQSKTAAARAAEARLSYI